MLTAGVMLFARNDLLGQDNMNSANNKNTGFTLIELMVAMALSTLVMIGIISV